MKFPILPTILFLCGQASANIPQDSINRCTRSDLENFPFVRGGEESSFFNDDFQYILNCNSRRKCQIQNENVIPYFSSKNRRSLPSNSAPIQRRLNRNNRQSSSYRDVLECKSSFLSEDMEYEEEEASEKDSYLSEDKFSSLFDFNGAEKVDYRGKLEGTRELAHSPVVYQFYGRSRARGSQHSDSVHFILLGPNVDHWKVCGQILASRGFNAMACERLDGKNMEGTDRSNDAPNLVLEILEVLKWKRVILVGCDKESILAMETAMMLAPDRVAGLVLCGDLAEADNLSSQSGMGVLDSFLRQILDCPFLIVWDGDSPTLISGSSAHEAVETSSESNDRCLILGGGSAPHRIKPEQFTWVLTRFVEEKLELPQRRARISGAKERSTDFLRALNLPFGINSVVSPEGRLLLGRAAAAALLYITMMKVIIVQYGILRATLLGIKSRYDSVATLRRKLFQAITAFVVNYGYIPRLFKVKNYNEYSKDVESLPSSSEVEDDSSTTKDGDSTTKESEEENEEEEEEEEDPEEDERSLMKPFFFLDHIVT